MVHQLVVSTVEKWGALAFTDLHSITGGLFYIYS